MRGSVGNQNSQSIEGQDCYDCCSDPESNIFIRIIQGTTRGAIPRNFYILVWLACSFTGKTQHLSPLNRHLSPQSWHLSGKNRHLSAQSGT